MKTPERPIRVGVLAALLLLASALAAHAAAPVARDDHVVATDRYLTTVGGVETYSILIDVLANDEDADGDPLEVVITGDVGGLPPAIWDPVPVGTVSYLGAGLFDLTFGKDELEDAREVTFQYELEGAPNVATVRVTVAGEGPAQEVRAQDDEVSAQWACWLAIDVLANDLGLDLVQSFSQPDNGTVQRHPADPDILVYRGASDGTFTYTAASSVTGLTARATVDLTPPIAPKTSGSGFGEVELSDCFDRADGTALDGEVVAFYAEPTTGSAPTWSAWDLTHLDQTATQSTTLSGGSTARRKGYVAFDADSVLAARSATALDLRASIHPSPGAGDWIAVGFSSGTGSLVDESILSARIAVDTGDLTLYGRRDGAVEELLGTATPTEGGYTFVENDLNRLQLRLDTATTPSRLDVWINGTRVLSEPFLDGTGQPVPGAEITGAIENAGFHLSYGTHPASPGDLWMDDFEVRVGVVEEPRVQPKSDDPNTGVDVPNGSTVTVGPVHVGCTAAHVGCNDSAERSVWLTNGGNQPLEVTNVSFDGPTEWTLVEPSLTTFSVAAGGEAEIRVRVDALEVGPTESRLEILTDDPDAGKLVIHFAADVKPAPIADFVHYCSTLDCSFDAGRSTGSGLNDFSYLWYLDDQYAGYGSTLSHTFATSGVHTVELRVQDDAGAEHRLRRDLGIAPEAAFTSACSVATRTCDFDAALTSAGVAGYRFELGDGRVVEGTGHPGASPLFHTYATSGRYDATLVVWDADGQEDAVTHEVVLPPVPAFTTDCSAETRTCTLDASASTPSMTLYEWQLGDGTLATGPVVEHTYAVSGLYSVVLTIVDQAGQLDAISQLVSVPPHADFSVSCDPDLLTCSFDGSGSSPAVTHNWDFGDGSPPADGPLQSHTYGTSGVFTVTLAVTDVSGQTGTATRDVVLPPTASFTVACDGLSCSFDASDSSPGVTAYDWSFGHDSATATGVTPIHDFPDAGDYDVRLTVTDGAGQTATATHTVSVLDEELLLLILLERR